MKAVPAELSRIENGVPDWKMLMPLIDQSPSAARRNQVAPLAKGRS
jgi:hypothetical protein